MDSEIKFCMECGSPLVRYVWQLRRRDPRLGPPDTAIPKPIEPYCFYGCPADGVVPMRKAG